MKEKNSFLSKALKFIFATDSEIQVVAFNILAFCGIMVSLVTAIYYVIIRPELLPFLERMSGVFVSLALMIFTRKTGKYKLAMVITVVVIFLGLFSFLFFNSGGYCAGFPYFFVFAVVFTAFLLNGPIMPILVGIEIVWYGFLCLYTYYNPIPYYIETNSQTRPIDVIVCETIVSLSLALTMYFQIRVYRKKQIELNEAIVSAEKANKAKSDFIAKMSHDVRTPLNTILAMNELIVANTSSERIREWVNDSSISGQLLLSMIDDMLDLTRIEAGRIVLLSHPWNTHRLFDEISRIWKMNAGKEGLKFIYTMDDNVPAYLCGDEGIIRKISDNLLSNAVKYTKTGSIELTVRMNGNLEIIVADTGVGIAPEYLENIFKPFDRGVEDIYRETSGSGLGLAIVKELAEAAGGNVECQSTLGEGTTFTVSIPQKEASEEKELTHRDVGADDKKTAEKTVIKHFIAPEARILVVDDNAYNRKVIRGFTESTLIQVDDVESGYEALEMIDIKDYDLVLMDIRMPKMDGKQTLEKIKQDYPDFSSPVVALTGDIMTGVEEDLLGRGFSGFLAKPVSSSKLLKTIMELIPKKVVALETVEDESFSPAKIEWGQKILMPYGIDLKMALEYSAGDSGEFENRALLFEEYAESSIDRLRSSEFGDDFYIQIHSIKSIAKGVGAFLLAQLAETVEYRKDDDFSREVKPILITEYSRVCEGLGRFREEVNDFET